MNLWQLLDQLELLTKQLEEMDGQILSILAEFPEAEKLLRILGIGMVVAAGFLAEVGDVRRFTDPKQIQKLAGLAVAENSSGKHKGQSGISRRGRKRPAIIGPLKSVRQIIHGCGLDKRAIMTPIDFTNIKLTL